MVEVKQSAVVIGHFIEKAIQEVEPMIKEGFQEVEVIEPLALTHFDSPVHSMKFIRTQKEKR